MLNTDINCDMGESYGNYTIGNDLEIMPHISSCNVACGFHGGDPLHIERTLKNAKLHNLRVGAHPGYPDLNGFGRRNLQMSEDELRACIKYQVSAIWGMAKSMGLTLAYVKPHGALYNKMADNKQESKIVIQAVLDVDSSLAVMGLAGSKTELTARSLGVPFIAEAFADRKYTAQGRLASRKNPDSVIVDPKIAAEQALNIIQNNPIQTLEGDFIHIRADSICVHGDNKNAVLILQEIKTRLQKINN
ncbi:MAG: LamB/YcsF family protein [Saprospiraceae bacterium]|nr:LamB/YcsF family protein [Saprospiraceae bacterium]